MFTVPVVRILLYKRDFSANIISTYASGHTGWRLQHRRAHGRYAGQPFTAGRPRAPSAESLGGVEVAVDPGEGVSNENWRNHTQKFHQFVPLHLNNRIAFISLEKSALLYLHRTAEATTKIQLNSCAKFIF